MKIIKLFSLTAILLIASKAMAQEFKLGKVSIAELEQKAHPKDSAAAAAILYKKGTARIEYDPNDGFVTLTDVETRIKIYRKEGYDWANQAVWYQNNSNLKEKVFFGDVVTYNLVNGKIEKTKLKSDGVFDEVLSKYVAQKKMTMPNVKEGSVIEFRYTIKCPSPRIIREWAFQSSIPVNYSEFSTFIPEYYVFNSRQKGYLFPKVTTARNPKSVTFNIKERNLGPGSAPTTFSTEKHDYMENQTTFIATDLPAMKDEAYVNNIENYMSAVSHELSLTKFPNSPMKEYSSDWNSVVRTIYEYDDFGPELNKTGYFEEDLKKLLAETKTPEEKIWVIFNHVKANIKWNSYTGYACDNGVKKAYKEKTGNIADINLMLTAMLRYSGLTANPVLVSTRSNGIALFPNRTAFNYVIAAVETPNGNILLDATDKYSIPNVLPLRVLNWSGRLIRKDGSSEEINLMPEKTSADNVFMNYSIDNTGKVTGKTRRQCMDYNAMITRSNIESLKEEEYLEKLENQNNKIEISEYSKTNEKDMLLPIIETYSFTGNNLCELIGDKIYVSPMLFFTNDKNPFKQEVREYPVDFSYPFADKYNITIKIPEGFAVETLPAPAALTMEDNLGAFKFNIAANGDTLQLSILHQINEAIVSTEKYDMLKEYYKTMIAKQTEKIVLKRI
ncbi:transglutaminase domain-containing protein [Flavobacterium sp. LHD-85]|uniref:transglutaminase domain-containing protein n=1 Tax=Flavobacterium sp. LHD-85 TaxID=3071410 RepID=UPI0027DF0F70|nr:transglutaminase domain-containing protein [Flavobacterium sp. LHD-85]MDQ6531985.1 transglutaminase [Flavobacterium sp. LHD-85]